MRVAEVERRTRETSICLRLSLDGEGRYRVRTGIGFLDHMLALWARHALFDLDLEAEGDLEVDAHHTVEDIGICLGMAFGQALGAKEGITRYGSSLLPMDEVLVLVALDLSGRPFLSFEGPLPAGAVGGFPVELLPEFLRAFVNNSGTTLHVRVLSGGNAHHLVEAVFKGWGRALREAVRHDPRERGVPSTKGEL